MFGLLCKLISDINVHWCKFSILVLRIASVYFKVDTCLFFFPLLNDYVKVKMARSCPTLCDPMNYPWNSLGQNTGVGSLSLLQLPLTGPQNWTDLIVQSQAGLGGLLCRTSSGKERKRWVLPLGNLLLRAKSWTTYAQFFILNCQSNEIIPPDLRKIEWGDTDKLRCS